MFFVARGNISDDGLRPFVHMNVLDPDELRATLAQPPQRVDLTFFGPPPGGLNSIDTAKAALAMTLGDAGDRARQ